MDEIGLILLGIAWAIGTPIVALVALVRTSRLSTDNDRLGREVAALRAHLAAGGGAFATPPLVERAPVEPAAAEAAPFEVPVAEPVVAPPPVPVFEPMPAPPPAAPL